MLIESASLSEDAELPLALKAGGALSGFAVNVKNVAFRYSKDTPMLFRGAELGVDSSSRIVLLGENGNGKTTLVKLLLGDLEPTEGDIFRAGGARVALVNQHHADQIDLTLSPLQFMMDKFPVCHRAGSKPEPWEPVLLRSHVRSLVSFVPRRAMARMITSRH